MMKHVYILVLTSLALFGGELFGRQRIHSETKNYCHIMDEYDAPRKAGDPLRILFVTSSFPRFDQQFILNQICGVMDRGHEIYIAATRPAKESIIPEIVHDYKLLDRTLYFGRKNPFKILQRHRASHHNLMIPPIDTFDVICSQFGDIGARVVQFKKELEYHKPIKAKLVTCFRGRDTSEAVQTNSHLYDELFREGDLFLPVCNFFLDRLVSIGCNPQKARVLYSAIDCDRFSAKPRTMKKGVIKLISVSRLVEKKGIEYTIRAVAEVARTNPKIHYTIVGDGPIRGELQSLINKLRMQKHITMVGAQPNEKIPSLLYKSHVFVLSSITAEDGDQEGIANALKEAMATCMPVLTTETAGTAELVENGVSGFLVKEKDVNGLAQKIKYFMQNPHSIPQMGVAGRRKVEKYFHITPVIDRFIMLLEELCVTKAEPEVEVENNEIHTMV
jgi:colanic acid/amylovoran biosynthesis glycosyltransferase